MDGKGMNLMWRHGLMKEGRAYPHELRDESEVALPQAGAVEAQNVVRVAVSQHLQAEPRTL